MLIDKLRGKDLDEFFDAILALETVEECYSFFDDLCTVNEMKTIFQRFKVAKMLYKITLIKRLKRRQVLVQQQFLV